MYFWRWATWKVFDHDPQHDTGVICFITVAGFLNGPGFQGMRDYLRRKADHVWVIDCTPEGHQPDGHTRIFQGVQQPVCIVMAARTKEKKENEPAKVKYIALPEGDRADKFKALDKLKLGSKAWQNCSIDWRTAFLPAASDTWANYPALDELFAYNGSGVQPARTWIIAPDAGTLERRWETLIRAKEDQKEDLFQPHLRDGKPCDRHTQKVVTKGLPGFKDNPTPLAKEKEPCLQPHRYGYRSFDRQWIIPDNRVINQPNPNLWRAHSVDQIYLTALHRTAPSGGSAISITCCVPDYDHYKGSFGGRVFPLWRDPEASDPNLPPKLLDFLTATYKKKVTAEDLFAYVAGVAAHPGYTTRFQKDLAQPGLRIPVTEQSKFFFKAAELGRRVIWLHTFGERFADSKAGRPQGPPRLPGERAPKIPRAGKIPDNAESMPDEIGYDINKQRLLVGSGFVENVPSEVWHYEVSGKRVLNSWFSYRKKNRERPIIGKRPAKSMLWLGVPSGFLQEGLRWRSTIRRSSGRFGFVSSGALS